MTQDVLPDSRCQVRRGSTRVVFAGQSFNMIPIFCASCGAPGGMVQERFMTHAFWTCQKCDEQYGVIAGLMCEPDQVFWDRVAQVQAAEKLDTPLKFNLSLQDPSSELSKIAREWRAVHIMDL